MDRNTAYKNTHKLLHVHLRTYSEKSCGKCGDACKAPREVRLHDTDTKTAFYFFTSGRAGQRDTESKILLHVFPKNYGFS